MATRAKMVPHPAQTAQQTPAVEATAAEAEAAMLDAYGEVAEEPAGGEEDASVQDGEGGPAEQAIDEASGLPLWGEIDLDGPDAPKPLDTRTARAKWRGRAFDIEYSYAKTSLAFMRGFKAQVAAEAAASARAQRNGHAAATPMAQVDQGIQMVDFWARYLASSLVSWPMRRNGAPIGTDYESLARQDGDLLKACYDAIQEAGQVPNP